MQAKQKPDWTADDAFWDDAWADMQQRLDEKPVAKKRAAGWWWVGGGATLLLLAGLFWLGRTDAASANKDTTPGMSAPVPEQAAPTTRKDAIIATNIDVPPANISPSKPPEPAASGPGNKAVNRVKPTLVAAGIPDSGKTSERASPTLLSPTFPASGAPAPTVKNDVAQAAKPLAPLPYQNQYVPVRLVATPFALVSLSDQFDPVASRPATISRQPRPGALSILVGASSDLALGNTGYFVGLSYDLPLGQRLSVPLSLRYRQDQLALGDYPSGGLLSDAIDNNAVAEIDSNQLVFEQYTINFGEGTLRSRAVDLGVGLRWRVGKRLHLNTGLNASYNIAAQLRNLSAVNNANAQNENLDFSATDLFRSGNLVALANFPDANFSSLTTEAPITPRRWLYRLHIGAEIDLTPWLSVTATLSSLLRQFDEAEQIGVQRGRLEIGGKYRIR